MRKALYSVAAVVVLVVISWFVYLAYSRTKEGNAAAAAWPSNLGPVENAVNRYPDTEQSAGATKLVLLAKAAQLELAPRERPRKFEKIVPDADSKTKAIRTAIGDYVKAQFERSGDAIDPLPPLAARYLAENEAALNAVRDHLLSGAPIVWETKFREGMDAPIPNLVGHMHLQKILAARALDKARRNDPAAWDELHASHELNRSLWSRPDLVAIIVATAVSRMSNGAARKMPLPAPAWLDEAFTFDYAAAMAGAQHADAWTIHHLPVGHLTWRDVLRESENRAQEAIYLNTMRSYTAEALKSKACDADGPEFAAARAAITSNELLAIPNLVGAWHRVMRFRAELEATQRVLQLRAGQAPSTQSQCSDGTWQVTANGIKFTRVINVPPPQIRYPLEYAR